MSKLGSYAAINAQIVSISEAKLSIASSAVLYGLSVYSVFFLKCLPTGEYLVFRINDHLKRLKESAEIIGLSVDEDVLDPKIILPTIKELIAANKPTTDQFFRMTLHVTELVPGVRTTDLKLELSIFAYEAKTILPEANARIKTSLWRRVADTAIPPRAKVNGAYVNSALAKQDAINSGYDDCLFLNQNGYVSELSAANVFMVKNRALITPDCASDILEGITRRSVISLAKQAKLEVVERKVALTELYAADEIFACGTSAFISPLKEIDNHRIGTGEVGQITQNLKHELTTIQADPKHPWITVL